MKLVILEDNPSDCKYLCKIIKKWEKDNNLDCIISKYTCGEDFLSSHINITDISAFFLDINLKSISGMEIAYYLRAQEYKGEIIFLTASKDYVFQGYDVRALKYLLKPVSNVAILKCLTTIYSHTLTSNYTYHHRSDYISIPYKDIICFLSCQHNIEIITTSTTYTEHISFRNITQKLPSSFLKINRSYIVNMAHIRKITKNIAVLSNNLELTIGRAYIKDTIDRFHYFSTTYSPRNI